MPPVPPDGYEPLYRAQLGLWFTESEHLPFPKETLRFVLWGGGGGRDRHTIVTHARAQTLARRAL